MTNHPNPNSAAQAANENPLSDEYVNAIIQRHGYDSPETVIARLAQWIGLHGGENGVTLLMYEAHKTLSKLRAPVADERAAFARAITGRDDLEPHQVGNVIDANGSRWKTWQDRAALASAPVADERALPPLPHIPTSYLQLKNLDKIHGMMRDYARFALASAPVDERAALQTLVKLEDMRLRLRALHESGHGTDYDHYHKALPAAWEAARAALASASVSDERVWGASSLADLCAALDGAHELSGPPHERIRRLIEQRDEARAALTSAPVADERALDLLDTLFTAYENGTPCYEEPDSQGGYLGMAFRMDDDTFRACADLLNKERPRTAAALAGAPVAKPKRAPLDDWRVQAIAECLETEWNDMTPASAEADARLIVGYLIAYEKESNEIEARHAAEPVDPVVQAVRNLRASSPVAGEAAGEIVLFGGELKEVSWRDGKMPPAGTKLYAAPQASAEDVRNAALEEAATVAENSYADAHIRIRALKQPQADKDGEKLAPALPDCGGPLCAPGLHHPLCHQGWDADAERQAWEKDMVAAGAEDLGDGCWEWREDDFEFHLWQIAVRQRQRDTLLSVLGRLNSNPYNLMKYECVDLVREMFNKANEALHQAGSAKPTKNGGNHG